jgi:RHS repeat-associated protein
LNLKRGTANYSYLYDGSGNVDAVLNSAQNVVAAYRYDPFGNVLAKTGTFNQPYGFSTKRYDAGIGLLQYEYRNYLPAIGRWTTRDPLGEAGGLNLYAFVGNNPVNWVDPWGLEYAEIMAKSVGILGGITGGVAGASGGVVVCIPSGPGTLACGTVGAVEGAAIGTAAGAAVGYTIGSAVDTLNTLWPLLFPPSLSCEINDDTDMSDPNTWPAPPGSGPFTPGEPSRKKPRDRGEKSFYDKDGGEWRPHKPDPYHPNGHWDYKAPGPSSPWVDIPF